MASTPDPGTENGVFVRYRGMAMVTVVAAPGSKIHTRRVLGSDGYWYFVPPDAEVVPDVAVDLPSGLRPTDDGADRADLPERAPRPSDNPVQPNTQKTMWKDNRFVRIEDVPLGEWD